MVRFMFLFLIFLCSDNADATSMEFRKLLLQDLFQNYSKDLRPVKDQSKPVQVHVELKLVSINDFDEIAGTISIVASLFISWIDESLVWNSTSYGNTTSLMFSQDKIWLPEMFLGNPADSFLPISNQRFKVEVASDGGVLWKPGALLKGTCIADVSKFPFDQHTCTIQIAPWGFSNQNVQVYIPSSSVSFKFFALNPEWDVIGSAATRWSQSYDMAQYHITIKRRHMNFIVTVVIPIIMLAFVNPFVFIMPLNSGERASYNITVLLAFTVYMTVVSDRMPASSEPMSFIFYYLISLLGISVSIVTLNIFQIRIYSKHDGDEPVPDWLRKGYNYIQTLSRSKRVKSKEQNDIPAETDGKTNNESKNKETQSTNLESSTRNKDSFYASILPVSQMKEKAMLDTFSLVNAYQPEVVTWYMVAKVVDKFYFALFVFATVFATVLYFVVVN